VTRLPIEDEAVIVGPYRVLAKSGGRAAAVVLMEARDAEKRRLQPLRRLGGGGLRAGLGIGPMFAVRKLLKRHG